jgi:AbrB family looped-hinge helix DNA binding protein
VPTIDSKGRVVLPQALRERYGLQEGSEVEFDTDGEKIILRPSPTPEEVLARMDELLGEPADRTDVEPTSPPWNHGEAERHRRNIREGTSE